MVQKWSKSVTALVFAAIVVGGMMMGLGAAADSPPTDAGAELVHDTVQTGTSAISLTIVEIQDEVQVPDVKRLGINVGSRSQWGAALPAPSP
jgi:hypothetical protein